MNDRHGTAATGLDGGAVLQRDGTRRDAGCVVPNIGVQCGVPVEVEARSVPLICAGPRHHGDYAAGRPSELGLDRPRRTPCSGGNSERCEHLPRAGRWLLDRRGSTAASSGGWLLCLTTK